MDPMQIDSTGVPGGQQAQRVPLPSRGQSYGDAATAEAAATQELCLRQIQAHQQQHSTMPSSSQQTQQCLDFQGQQSKGGAPNTAPFLRDFNLVAEAAKRAQMAVLMREMEGVAL